MNRDSVPRGGTESRMFGVSAPERINNGDSPASGAGEAPKFASLRRGQAELVGVALEEAGRIIGRCAGVGVLQEVSRS